MSLLPLFLNDTWETMRPSRILDQHFGLTLEPEDLLLPLTLPISSRYINPRYASNYYRPWAAMAATGDAGSIVKNDKDKYEVNLDVQQFAPDEISVRIIENNMIFVEGKHEEKKDEHGFISRHFIRKYLLPPGHDINNIVSKLSSDGVLTITAPCTNHDGEKQRIIPIQQTGMPLKSKPAKIQDQDTTKDTCAKKQ